MRGTRGCRFRSWCLGGEGAGAAGVARRTCGVEEGLCAVWDGEEEEEGEEGDGGGGRGREEEGLVVHLLGGRRESRGLIC